MAMSSFSFHLSNLLDKMTSSDKDYRFMACNDLISELQKDSIKLDDEFEKKVVKQLLKLLEDKSGEVQNLAVKCLGLLVLKVKESQVELIIDQLCSNMTCDKEELRDISSIGLKTVIAELPSTSINLVIASCKKTTQRLVKVINQSDVSVQLEALDILADMLSRFGSLLTQHHDDILACLLPQLKSARLAVRKRAIIAIGHLSMSCNQVLFNRLIDHLLSQLLHSLKEVISSLAASPHSHELLKPYLHPIWSTLFSHCECSEEGTRNVVAECLGKLTLIEPHMLLPKLREQLSSPSSLARSTVVTAVKFTITDQPQEIDPLLRECMSEFLLTMEDPDLNVRRVALVAFNSAAHNKPSLIRDLLDTILPQLYHETRIRSELIREVEMGPFKHSVDDGLDIRKAAFECMYTLLDSALARLDIFVFLNHVEDGLKDHYDIKMLTYLMIVRLAHLTPNAVLQRLDRLVEPFRNTCMAKVKANAVKQEFEKQDELKRSALRAVNALLHIPDADKNPQMLEFLCQIRGNAELNSLFESIQKEAVAGGAVSGSHADTVTHHQHQQQQRYTGSHAAAMDTT